MTHIQVPLAELEVGDKLAHIVRIKKINLQGKGKKPWLGVTIIDKSGEFFAKKWGSSEDEFKRHQNITVALITGNVEKYNDEKSFVLNSLAQISDDFPENEIIDLLGNPVSTSDGSCTSADYDGLFEVSTKEDVKFFEHIKNQKPLRELKEGDTIDHILQSKNFLLRKSREKESYYFDIASNDASKEMTVKRFRANVDTKVPDNIKAIYVKGVVDDWKGTCSIKSEYISLIPDATEMDVSALWPTSTFTIKELKLGIWSRVQKIKISWVKMLCEGFLKDPKYSEAFSMVPAGSAMHHNIKNGLLEHTYTASSMGNDITVLYNKLKLANNTLVIDPDIVFAGLMFHDAFKCDGEYAFNGDYQAAGNLLKHLERGISYVATKAASIPGFPEEIWQMICHIISAHHGKLEWGSWDEINSPYSSIVHHVDDLTSKLDPTVRNLHFIKDDAKYTTEKVKALGGSEAYRGNISFDKPNYDSPREIAITEKLTSVSTLQGIRDCFGRIRDPKLREFSVQLLDKFHIEATKPQGPGALRGPLGYEHYPCGLLEFTYRLMLLAEGMVYIWHQWAWPKNRVYLDVDTIVVGAFLTTFFQFRAGNPVLGDTSYALAQIGITASKIEGFSSDTKELLQHIVRSNLGRDDVRFISTESILIHYCYKMLNLTDRMMIDLSKDLNAEEVSSELVGRVIFRSLCKVDNEKNSI